MVAVIFVPKHLVMLITVYQTNTGHQAVSFNNESNAQNIFTLKCWSCHAFDIVHQLSSFFALCFTIFTDEDVRFCLANIFVKSLTNIFCLLPSFLKHFEIPALLCVVKGILLVIGLNLRYSLVLQISNIPYSLKKSVSCVKLFSLKNFTLSLNEAPKAHYFCFLLLIQSSGVQQKSNKVTLPNTKTFSTAKLALCVQSLCLILHNAQSVDVARSQFPVTWGFRFLIMLQRVHCGTLKNEHLGELIRTSSNVLSRFSGTRKSSKNLILTITIHHFNVKLVFFTAEMSEVTFFRLRLHSCSTL